MIIGVHDVRWTTLVETMTQKGYFIGGGESRAFTLISHLDVLLCEVLLYQ